MIARIIFEDAGWVNLLPLVYWRSVGELRCGQRLLLERHQRPGEPPGLWVRQALAEIVSQRYPSAAVNAPIPPDADGALLINARWLADGPLPPDGPPAVGVCAGQVAWLRLGPEKRGHPYFSGRPIDDKGANQECRKIRMSPFFVEPGTLDVDDWTVRLGRREPAGGVMIDYPWDLVAHNVRCMLEDWRAAGPPRLLGRLYEGVHLLDRANIHVGEGSTIKPCTVLDAEEGPIWIGSNVRIAPNCTIQGPVSICDGSVVQPGAVIRDGTTIGPVCKVGGEVEGSILWGYSNKQHDGFLGHACLGAWINIAADSVNSDLKNTYSPIRVPINGVEVDSGRIFVGLTMGDHSKSSINASFPTGAVVGFCSNVVCNAFPPKFVPSFCWLTDGERKAYERARGLAVARVVMARRQITMTAAEERLFLSIAELCRQVEKTAPLAPAET